MKEILLVSKRAWHRWVKGKIDGSLWEFLSQAIAVQKGWEVAAVRVVPDSKELKNIQVRRISRSE